MNLLEYGKNTSDYIVMNPIEFSIGSLVVIFVFWSLLLELVKVGKGLVLMTLAILTFGMYLYTIKTWDKIVTWIKKRSTNSFDAEIGKYSLSMLVGYSISSVIVFIPTSLLFGEWFWSKPWYNSEVYGIISMTFVTIFFIGYSVIYLFVWTNQ